MQARRALLAALLVPLAALAAAPRVEAVLCRKIVDDKPFDVTTTFPRDAAALHGHWKSKDGREGMVVRTVWIAEDVGKLAPPNTKVSENATRLGKGLTGTRGDYWYSAFSLSRPTSGWPVGKYHAEIWFDAELVKTLRFTIR